MADLFENYQETLSIKRNENVLCEEPFQGVLGTSVSTLYSMAAIHFKLLVKFSYFSIICQQEPILIQPHPCSINISFESGLLTKLAP